jgi:VCBS repeat-containing protein
MPTTIVIANNDYYTVYWGNGTWTTDQNVMSNDVYNVQTILWSVDDGTQNQTTLKPANGLLDMDLLARDAVGVDNTSSGGSLHLTGGEEKIDTSSGLITYHVTTGSQLYNYLVGLSDGETYEDTFAYSIDTVNGLRSQATVHITLAGHNWDPQIASANASGSVTEDAQGHGTGSELTSGTVAYTDLNTHDTHTASATAQSVGYLGTFSLDQSNIDTGNGGSVGWSFSVDDSVINYLAQGQTLIQKYDVKINDNHGGSVTQTVTVTITGTNDAPVAVADSNSVKEDTAPNPVSGNVLSNDTDVDQGDTHSVSAVNGSSGNVAADVAGTYGTLHLDSDGSYTYTLDNSKEAVQALAEGVTATDSFTYTNSDNHGATSSASLTITVVGTNDPAVIGGTDTGSVTEANQTNPGSPTATGTLTVSDPDTGQSSFLAQSNVATTYGHYTLDSSGNWTYTLDNSNPAVDDLDTGQTLHDLVTVYSFDGTSHAVDITINGAHDDQGGPAGIIFNVNPAAGNSLTNLGTFTATGDPDAGDNANMIWSIGAGSSSGFAVSGGILNASGLNSTITQANGYATLNLVATDPGNPANTLTKTYHVWIGTSLNEGSTNVPLVLSSTAENIGDFLSGNDGIKGSSGTDYIIGGDGNDTLTGAGGADQMVGGAGVDHFRYGALGDSTHAAWDTIMDWTSGADKIDFVNALALTGTPTNLGTVTGSTTLAAHSVGWTKVDGSHAIVYANTGSSAEAVVTGADMMEIHVTGVGAFNFNAATDFNLHA